MPPTTAVYTPPGDKDLDEVVLQERKARIAAIDRAFNYARGQHKKPLKTKDNVILNLTGQALDDLVEFLGIPLLEVPGGIEREPGPDGKLVTLVSAEQQALDDWWQTQELGEFVTEAAMSGFCAGHVFVRLFEDERTGAPAAALLDPRMVTVLWDAESVYRPLWYRILWDAGRDVHRCQDVVPGWLVSGERAFTEDGTATGADVWHVFEYELSSATSQRWTERAHDVWMNPLGPIVEWKNQHAPHEYYGESDVLPDLNDSINFVASNTAKIIKHHAGPQTIVTGGKLPDSELGPGTVAEIDDPNAKVYNLEMQSDLASSLNYLGLLREAFFSEMRVVDLSGIKDKLGQITNFGVKMLFVKMTNKLENRRRLYGKGFSEISRRALSMQGMDVETVEVRWPPMLPANRVELVQTLEKEQALGLLSKQTAADELGRDFESEMERIEEEGGRSDDALASTLERFGQRGGFDMTFGGRAQ